MARASVQQISPFRTDILAAGLVGVLASLFATIALTNLGLFGTEVRGIALTIPLVFVIFIILCLAGMVVARLFTKIPVLYKFIKFGEAGGLNWLVDLGMVNLLIFATGYSTGVYFAVFKGVAFLTAATNSFFWNKYWVFSGAKKQEEKKEIGKFATATALGMLFNIVIASVIAYLGPVLFAGIEGKTWANIATIIGSLSAMVFNFVLYKIWVFKN
jgi:putative flippase GtrA